MRLWSLFDIHRCHRTQKHTSKSSIGILIIQSAGGFIPCSSSLSLHVCAFHIEIDLLMN